MFNVEKYTAMGDSITFEMAVSIYNEIHRPESLGDSDFDELWQVVVKSALKYVTTRNHWTLMSQTERVSAGGSRTVDHNSYMASLRSLSRYCKDKWGATWMTKLGNSADDRKKIGDFAGYIVLFGTLKAR